MAACTPSTQVPLGSPRTEHSGTWAAHRCEAQHWESRLTFHSDIIVPLARAHLSLTLKSLENQEFIERSYCVLDLLCSFGNVDKILNQNVSAKLPRLCPTKHKRVYATAGSRCCSGFCELLPPWEYLPLIPCVFPGDLFWPSKGKFLGCYSLQEGVLIS